MLIHVEFAVTGSSTIRNLFKKRKLFRVLRLGVGHAFKRNDEVVTIVSSDTPARHMGEYRRQGPCICLCRLHVS